MYSLFQIKHNSIAVLIIAIALWLLLPPMSPYCYIAMLICVHQFVLLFNSIGHVIPVRYLFGSFMCLQFFIGPMFAYNGLDQYQFPLYRMQVSEVEYFSYAIPAVISFIIGLHIRAGNLKGEHLDQDVIKKYVSQNKNMPYIFIALGFFTSIISAFLPRELAFVFVILGGFKFVGLFMLIIGNEQLKIVPLVVVFGSIISSSLGSAMFHDLLTWLLFAGAIFCLKYKPSVLTKVLLCLSFVLLSTVIQQLKSSLRYAARQGKEGGLETLTDAYYAKQSSDGVFSFKSLAPSNVRINQGFIITYIMKTVPNKVPFSDGAELRILLESAFLPRVLAPNKLQAGDSKIFMQYTGMTLAGGTSMGLSSVGDAYINFGRFGGCVFMFVLGFAYGAVLNAFDKHSRRYSILILFVPLIFYYPIRPDSELQTLMGHVVKSCFLLFLIVRYNKKYFMVQPEEEEEIPLAGDAAPSLLLQPTSLN